MALKTIVLCCFARGFIKKSQKDFSTTNRTTLKTYIKEAISNYKAGLKVEFKKTKEYYVPQEFQTILVDMPDLKTLLKHLHQEDKESIY